MLPKWFELGDNELRYMLWRSKERLERGKEHPIDLARDIVKREELGLDGAATEPPHGETVAGDMLLSEEDSSGNNLQNPENEVPLQERTKESYTKRDGRYEEGLEDELQRIEDELRNSGEEASETNSQRETGVVSVRTAEKDTRRGGDYNRLNNLRERAQQIRDELASRKRVKEELKQKYGINTKGDISIENVANMFHDLNTDKAIGELFEKVYEVIKQLGIKFRFSENVNPSAHGTTAEFLKMAFFNWDSFARNRGDQGKAKTLLLSNYSNIKLFLIIGFIAAVQESMLGLKIVWRKTS